MDFFELKASIRSRVWDVMNTNGWTELDDFSLVISDKIAKKMIARDVINLTKILLNVKTNFFSANSISRKEFVNELEKEVLDLIELFKPLKRKKIMASIHTSYKEVSRLGFSKEVKKQILRNQDHCCAKCGNLLNVVDWDHKDGNRSNNDISNCQALCPICHAIKSRKKQSGIE